MSKITVTTIAGLTSGGDANTVKIESGDELNVVNGDLTVDTSTLKVDSSNNRVGMGTASPSRQVMISRSIADGSGELGIVSSDSSTSGALGNIHFGNSTDTSLASIRATADGATDSAKLEFNTEKTGAAIETAMRLDSNGRVTKPLQPCFSATATTTNVPLTTQTTVTLSSPRFNVGSHLSGNTFTAPTTGKYLFTYLFYFTQLDASHTTLDVHIKTSNKQYQQTWNPSAFMGSDSNFSVSGSQICDMDANDTTYFAVYVSGGGAQTDIHGDSQVSGCLLL